MSWIILVPFISFVINILLLTLLIKIWLRTAMGRVFAGFLAMTSLWAFSSWMMHADMPPSPLFWMRMEVGLPIFAMTFMTHLSTEFPRHKERTRLLLLVWYVWAVLILVLDALGMVIKGANVIPNSGGLVSIQFGPWMMAVWLYVLATIVASAILYFHSYFKSRLKDDKSHLKYPIVGTIMVFSGVLLNVVPGWSGYPFDLIMNLMFSLIVAYGIVRHSFLTPGIILRRSLIYLAIALAFNGLYIAGIALIRNYNAQIGNIELWLLLVPAAIILTVAYQPVRNTIRGWVDKIFLGRQYGYQKAMQGISTTDASLLNMDKLAPAVIDAITESIGCQNAAILVLNADQSALKVRAMVGEQGGPVDGVSLPLNHPAVSLLERKNRPISRHDMEILWDSTGHGIERFDLSELAYEWLVPLVCQGRLVGLLTLGTKRDRRPYSDDDIAIVSTISNQITVNIENARLYSDLHKAYSELKVTQENLIRSERTRAIGQIAAGIAHDFNNVLTVILGRSELMRERATYPKDKADLEIMLKAAADGAAIVKRLQGYVKPQAGGDARAIGINQIVKDALSMAEHRIETLREQRSVFIDVALNLKAVSPIKGEAADLRQALVNLLFNAIDAMPNGGRLEISTAEDNGWVTIAVKDTGGGIPPELRENLFRPFFTTKGSQGMGLGLSVAQIALGKFGGKIEVDSEPGKGSTFFVRLPVSTETTDARLSKSLGSKGKVGSILVIEDDKGVGESIQMGLSQEGHQVRLAHTGVEGLALFQAGQFDAVVCDWGLPDITGGDISLSIQRMRPGIPVLLITGWDIRLDPNERKIMGIVDIVKKPFTKEHLVKLISRLLEYRNPTGFQKSGGPRSGVETRGGPGNE